MVVTIDKLIARIKAIPNKNNSACILDYYNYILEKGLALNRVLTFK